MNMRVTVKIGSNVLTQPDGTLDAERLEKLVAQIAALRGRGVEVIVVSSGAVASGRSEIKPHKKLDAVQARQLFSAVGQAKLINRYYELFGRHNLCCGQVLTTKENFRSRRHYLTMLGCISTMLDNGVIPIVNENDTVSVTELMFTDNDELSGLISELTQSEALVILSNVDGVYSGEPGAPGVEVIREICGKQKLEQYISAHKSEFGRGGMLTKTGIAQRVAANGVAVYIANGKRDGILPDLILGEKKPLCTLFVPKPKATSSVKRWVAHSEAFAKGAIVVNEGAKKRLLQKTASILPIGVVRIEGEFEKDDVVKILDERGAQLGVGRVTVGSAKARQALGKKGEKELVHYDYLYLG
ncbi:MAG: glutamate 5-kinase [Prevotellaceae bacterium]|jgi:glutamate 5-kinase|nr:glutamate 5-kinase [Prevotellaceae bacterium]